MSIGWLFPDKADGGLDGFNDPGIETFQGARYSSLAREVLQNSMDAKASADKPVSVTFELTDEKTSELFNHDELKRVVKECLAASEGDKEKYFFQNALKVLQKDSIPCLKIDDYNTTGLRGGNSDRKSQWYAITKMMYTSVKPKGSGGSYGIGKHAAFVVSDLRTVFYYTMYQEGDRAVEKMQGKAILMSHKNRKTGGNTQGTGYYGITDQCAPIETREDIIPLLQRTPGKTGTTVLIPGFRAEKNWAAEIAAIVLSNFFYAIYDSKLEVTIVSSQGDEEFCIEKATLDVLFSQLLNNPAIVDDDDYGVKLRSARAYLDAIMNTDRQYKRDTQNEYLGHCELFVKQHEDFPQKVGVIRSTGMLITDEMQGLKRFSNISDFAAVLLCSSEAGNALLRNIENPQHDQFEPDRLDDPAAKRKGKAAIRSISKWVREELKKLIGEQVNEEPTPIDELADIIPDEDDDTLAGEDDPNRERNLEGNIVISPRPTRKPAPPSGQEGTGNGGGDNGGTGGRGGKGGSGTGDKAAKTLLPIRNFRITKAGGLENQVVFTPKFDGDALLSIYIAGDSDTERLSIKNVTGYDKIRRQDGQFLLKSCRNGEKIRLDVIFGEKISYPLAIELTQPSKEK